MMGATVPDRLFKSSAKSAVLSDKLAILGCGSLLSAQLMLHSRAYRPCERY
jgi:hypothetical protein